ncbi:CheR family methyltransferase [Marinicellulosiphila megalodicopiae]|uniref:CheR family methyltransferase n=1 Tax=Marinicellulosiphila megalodicopiae TaxID=2724896 RepID=UPI003BB1BA3E
MADFLSREFPMTETNFQSIAKIAYEVTGIVLGEHKKDLVYSRISRRIRSLKLHNFDEYINVIEDNNSSEFTSFVNSITTNLTSFFREPHHFDFLKETALPALKKKGKTPLIWSAGCSTGEEPYSIAMTLDNFYGGNTFGGAKILATDLDSNVIDTGRCGIYDASRIEALDTKIKQKYFKHLNDEVAVSDKLKPVIQFNRLNLLGPWPMKKKFDIIFCRNVIIYFNKETQLELFKRYQDALNPNGYLIIGHSENLHGVTDNFISLGKTIYQKK